MMITAESERRSDALTTVPPDSTYCKTVDSRELEFTMKAHAMGLTPNILSVVHESANKHVITMEHYGLDLNAFGNMHSMTFEFKQYVTHEVERMINTLHANGIFHGDFHSGNIMLKRAGTTYTLRLIDFGLAYYEHEDLSELLDYYCLPMTTSISELKTHELHKWERDMSSTWKNI